MVDECDIYGAVVEKASQCLELAERCYLETFSTATHFTHCNLCTGTLLYISGQKDSVQTNLANVFHFLVCPFLCFYLLASSLAHANCLQGD